MDLIATYPVLSSVRANNDLLNYKGGIITNCSTTATDLSILWYDVQVIGYNHNDRYWIVKNSMG